MEAEHANCHHSLLTLPSANLAATSKVAHSCMHHIFLCNNIVLREYSNMLKQYNMLQQYKHCYNMLQHLQVCSIVALQNCSNAKTSITWCTARTVRSVWAGPSTVGKANACYGGLRSDETNMLCNFSSFTFTLDQDMYA